MMTLLYLLLLVFILLAPPGYAAPFEDSIPPVSPYVRESMAIPMPDVLECGIHVFTHPAEYVIQSPNYPNNYTNDIDCEYDISTTPGNVVDLDCSAISLEDQMECKYDYLQVGETIYCGEHQLRRLTGKSYLYIYFHTDFSIVSTGFSCNISVRPFSSPGGSAGCRCGVANRASRNRASRIVGGEDTEEHEYPWQVGLWMHSEMQEKFCGGAILNSRYILTAAHCLSSRTSAGKRVNYTADQIEVMIGQHALDVNTSSYQNRVERIITHPKFLPKPGVGYDIALLKLESAIEFPSDNTVAPVCLPADASNDYEGVNAIVAGWGRTAANESESNRLLEVTVPVLSNADCNSTYKKINPSMLCAGDMAGGKGACTSDDGAPLVTADDDGTFTVIGVVSLAKCAKPGFPALYARVTHVLDWINEQIADGMFCQRNL